MSGPEFLKKKYNLHATSEVEDAAERTRTRTGERINPPLETIQNYLDRFKEITEREDGEDKARGLRALKKILHENFVIKGENIPESYFALQQQIAREIGHGTIEITPELRREAVKVIQSDQKASLNEWVDYLSSGDALYPDWAKYWAFRGVLGMSLYDKEKKQFGNRTKNTTAKFPDLNPEALAYVVDLLEKKLRGEAVPNPVKRGENEFAEEGKLVSDEDFERLVSTESFPNYYAFAIEHVVADNSELFKTIEGEWRVFKEDSDPLELTKTLQGHGTGWCTAGESTAASQLETGDFYVYYSNNAHGDSTIPRLAIRMEYDDIAEVRGVAHKQEIDPYIAPILEEKLGEFGSEGDRYKKKAEDMKRLTALDEKNKLGEPLTNDELTFLYEVKGEIEGFGYSRDPRIDEIIESRDRYTDLRTLMNAGAESDKDFVSEFMNLNTDERARLLGIRPDEEREEIDYDKYDDALRKLFIPRMAEMKGLTADIAEKFLDGGYSEIVAEGFDAFVPKDKLKVLGLIIQHDRSEGTEHRFGIINKAFEGVPNIEKIAFIETKISGGEDEIDALELLLPSTTNIPIRIARKLIKVGHAGFVAKNLEVFSNGLDSEIATSLIDAGYGPEVAGNLKVFKGVSADVYRDLNNLGLLNDEKVKAENRIVKKNPFGQFVEMDPDEDFIDPDIFAR